MLKRERAFLEGEEVYVKNYGQYGQRWLEGQVVKLLGPVSALVELSDGSRVRRHFEQMRKCYSESGKAKSQTCLPENFIPSSVSEPTESSSEVLE